MLQYTIKEVGNYAATTLKLRPLCNFNFKLMFGVKQRYCRLFVLLGTGRRSLEYKRTLLNNSLDVI